MSKVKFKINKNFEKNYMKMRGWGVVDLSNALGYKKQQVSSVMTGAIEPSMQFLHRLCALTNMPVSDLIETVFVK